MASWKRIKVSDVADVVGGATPSTKEPTYWGGVIPWLTPKDLSTQPSKYTSRGSRSISEAGLSSSGTKLLPAGSVLLSSRAPIGLVSIAANPLTTNQGFKSLVLNESQSPEFWYYLLRLNTAYLESVSSGSTFSEISVSVVKNLEFLLPDIAEQRRIAGVLGALDDLIDINVVMASKLETLVADLSQQLLAKSADDDQVVSFSAIADIQKGYSYKSAELVADGDWLVNLKNIDRNGGFRVDGYKPLSSHHAKPSQVVENGDLVVALTDLTQAREVIGRPVRIRRGNKNGQLIASLDLAVVRPKPGTSREFLQAAISSQAFRDHALGYCNGTTVLHMSAAALPAFLVTLPERQEIDSFSARVSLLNEAIDDAYDSVERYSEIRDELLPLLMSGKIRVREAEKVVASLTKDSA